MTLDEEVLRQRRALLAEKLGAIERLVGHLEFSRGRLVYPLSNLDDLDPIELESVSALIERFGKLQDLLGGVFRELSLLAGDEVSDMGRVVASMEKLGVLRSAELWKAMRLLRNLGAHEYDPADEGRVRFVNALAADVPELIAIARRTLDRARTELAG